MERNKFLLRLVTAVAMILTIQNWWLPLMFARRKRLGRECIRFRDSDRLTVSMSDWKVVPSLARLKLRHRITVREAGEMVQVAFPSGACFELSRAGIFWQIGSINEVFDWDDYRVRGRDLTGQVVVDVGGFIGDSALLYASKGATVHVFEPIPSSVAAMRRNLELSGDIGRRVTIHPVGLACGSKTVNMTYDPLKTSFCSTVGMYQEGHAAQALVELADADDYLSAHGLNDIDILKMDCEGCEYELMGKTGLLKVLRPREVAVEYHAGSAPLVHTLSEAGYSCAVTGGHDVGLLFGSILVPTAKAA